jgi:hypothetical protein
LQTLVERHGPRWALIAKELNCLLKKGLEQVARQIRDSRE